MNSAPLGRVATLRIRNGPARGHRVTVQAGEDGTPPTDVFVRMVGQQVQSASQDVRGLSGEGWQQYTSQKGERGAWELVLVEPRGPAPS